LSNAGFNELFCQRGVSEAIFALIAMSKCPERKERKQKEKKNRTFSSVVVALREFMSYEIRYPHPP
jgi:hypothetical protein